MCITRVKWNTSINNFKNVNLPFLQGIRFNIFLFAPTITKDILRSSDLSTTFREINIRGKSIFRATPDWFGKKSNKSKRMNAIWSMKCSHWMLGLYQGQIKKISISGNACENFRLGRQTFFFWKKYNFMHFEKHFAFQNALNYIFTDPLKKI